MEFIKKKKDMSFLDDKAVALLNAEIILTQKCNLACPHCMRGCSTNKEITPEALDGFLSKICPPIVTWRWRNSPCAKSNQSPH